jgi:phosphate transport system substrate-binding protein
MNYKTLAFAFVSLAFSAATHADSPALSGAGSSAAAPVYKVWSQQYAKTPGGEPLSYAPVGSGAGMAKIRSREVDFGGSDVIATKQELDRDGLVMFPTAVTGIVPVINLPRTAPGSLRLSGDVLAGIFLGTITQWDAAPIRALNPGVALPSQAIRRVVRSDASGSTYHFTDYLSRVSPEWKQRHGVASKVEFGADALAVKGSAEVSKAVRATPGAIGYIDYNDVLDDGLTGVLLRNANGQFVAASPEGFRDAVSHSAWFATGDFGVGLNDLAGAKSWPITMGTFMVMPRVARENARTERTLRFIAWSYLHGDALARDAKFVPLPSKVQASAYREISRITGARGEPLGMKVLGSLVN